MSKPPLVVVQTDHVTLTDQTVAAAPSLATVAAQLREALATTTYNEHLRQRIAAIIAQIEQQA